MTPQQYCLRWKHHHTNVQSMFAQLLEKERFCDVTLYCSPSFVTQIPEKDVVVDPRHIRGVSLRAHRVVLAACSELLASLLGSHDAQGEPVLVIDGAEPKHLRALLDYMYTGEMNVHHSQLASLLKTAEELRIKGLTDIRWNNKDEPPDCNPDVVTAVATTLRRPDVKHEKQHTPKLVSSKLASPKHSSPKHVSPKHPSPKNASPKHSPVKAISPKQENEDYVKYGTDIGESEIMERLNVNGGPPPLIKLPLKEKINPLKRETVMDSDSPSPKRRRVTSATEHTDEDSVSQSLPEKDSEWQHGNLDITAERVVGWGGGSTSWSRENSEDEWADAPTDIGSFLHTKLRVDGDNSAGDESNDSESVAASSTSADRDVKSDVGGQQSAASKLTVGPKSGPTDHRFLDVVKLNEYLINGRRPQFWEEHYVKRVMEAVRMKELEMKQAAEILGVSYGTLYGRYRDVFGCINRPYRSARDFWQAKGPSEVLDRLQRGDISLEAASLALGVGVANLAAFLTTDLAEKGLTVSAVENPHVPIEVGTVMKPKKSYSNAAVPPKHKKSGSLEKLCTKNATVGSLADDEPTPATVISTGEHSGVASLDAMTYDAESSLKQKKSLLAAAVQKTRKSSLGYDKNISMISVVDEDPIPATVISMGEGQSGSGKWPTIRVASLDTLRPPTSPSSLMRTRPDLTIVAARRTPEEN